MAFNLHNIIRKEEGKERKEGRRGGREGREGRKRRNENEDIRITNLVANHINKVVLLNSIFLNDLQKSNNNINH